MELDLTENYWFKLPEVFVLVGVWIDSNYTWLEDETCAWLSDYLHWFTYNDGRRNLNLSRRKLDRRPCCCNIQDLSNPFTDFGTRVSWKVINAPVWAFLLCISIKQVLLIINFRFNSSLRDQMSGLIADWALCVHRLQNIIIRLRAWHRRQIMVDVKVVVKFTPFFGCL